jgi:hypothetical protein
MVEVLVAQQVLQQGQARACREECALSLSLSLRARACARTLCIFLNLTLLNTPVVFDGWQRDWAGSLDMMAPGTAKSGSAHHGGS